MKFDPPLARATLVRRYKRFLADLELPDGSVVTAHCPNTGAMLGCDEPGSEAWYSESDNPKRKYARTLEVVEGATGRAGINSARANALIREALQTRTLEPFGGMEIVRAEAVIPDESGRFDFLLRDDSGRACYLEIKNMTLCDATGRGRFPDAMSDRAVKHVKALMRRVAAGDRATLVFCAQHTGISVAGLADDIHPEYGSLVREAIEAGVEVFAFGCTIVPEEIRIARQLRFEPADQRGVEAKALNVRA